MADNSVKMDYWYVDMVGGLFQESAEELDATSTTLAAAYWILKLQAMVGVGGSKLAEFYLEDLVPRLMKLAETSQEIGADVKAAAKDRREADNRASQGG